MKPHFPSLLALPGPCLSGVKQEIRNGSLTNDSETRPNGILINHHEGPLNLQGSGKPVW